MSTTTANLGLTLPTPNVDSGWGGTLNTDFTLIDDLFTANGSGTSVGLQVGTGKTLNAGGTIIAGGTLILGSGDGTGTVAAPTIRGAARTGTNAVGPDLTIDALNGTGSGGSGKIIFRTAPAEAAGTTANTMASRLEINAAGAIGIGGASYGSANQVLFSNGSGAVPSWGNVTGSVLTIASQAQGDILYRGASAWERLPAGTSGQLLKTNGAGAAPSWTNSITSATAQTAASTAFFDFTNIPAGVKLITVMFSRVSLNGSNNILVQLGDSGGIETSGYSSGSARIAGGGSTADGASSSGFNIFTADSGNTFSGIMTIANVGGNTWVASVVGVYNESAGSVISGGGSKSLSATLDRIRITKSGFDTFDNGTVNITYQ